MKTTQQIPVEILDKLFSEEEMRIVENWWNNLVEDIQNKLITDYDIERKNHRSLVSLNYYMQRIEKTEYFSDGEEYMEDLREFFVNHEIGLLYTLVGYNRPRPLGGGSWFGSKSRYQILLEKYNGGECYRVSPSGIYRLSSPWS